MEMKKDAGLLSETDYTVGLDSCSTVYSHMTLQPIIYCVPV